MLSKITRGNQVTIPKAIVKRLGLHSGSDYVEVEYRDGVIYLKPVDIEERIPLEALEKLKKKAIQKEKGDVTLTVKEAEGFLAQRARKSNKE